MALNIKDPETDRLARELAQLTGTSITDALKTAIQHELASARKRDDKDLAAKRAKIQAIIDRARLLPVLDDRSADEILGYDENGLPT